MICDNCGKHLTQENYGGRIQHNITNICRYCENCYPKARKRYYSYAARWELMTMFPVIVVFIGFIITMVILKTYE